MEQVLLDPLELQDHRVHRVRLASQDSKVPLDQRDSLVHKVHSRGPLAVQVQRDLRDRRAILEIQDLRVAQDQLDRLDHLVQQDLRDLLVQADRLDLLGSREEQGPQGPLDNQETVARQVLLDL